MNPRQQRVIPHQLNLTRQPMALAMPTHLKIEIETASRRLNTSSLGPTCQFRANRAFTPDSFPTGNPWPDFGSKGRLHLTEHSTFAETPEPTRSDCHAWSACPNYDFLDIICGIQPASPGFKTVEIRPALGDLQWAAASMPHPRGTIEVRFERRDGGGITADITLPAGLTGDFVWQGKRTALMSGKQCLEP
jgi:hypothetical protein